MMARRRLYGIDIVEPLGISQTQVAKRVRGDLAWSLTSSTRSPGCSAARSLTFPEACNYRRVCARGWGWPHEHRGGPA